MKGKKFLKLTDEWLGPSVPMLLRLVLEGSGWIRGEGGHLPTSTFQNVSPQIPHASDFIFQITATMEIKLYSSFNNNQKGGGKEGRKDRTKQEKTVSY